VLHFGLKNYNNVVVEWVGGATPTAYFYDSEGNQVSQEVLGDRSLAELLTVFEQHKFTASVETLPYGEPAGVKEYGGHTYKFYNVENTKDFALSFTGTLDGGYLATITNQQEQNFLGAALREFSITRAWLGGDDTEEEGVWKWTAGPEKGVVFWSTNPESNIGGFNLWFNGEPNDVDNEDCGIFFPDGWNDVTCATEKAALVVEFGDQPILDEPYPIESPAEITPPEAPKTDL